MKILIIHPQMALYGGAEVVIVRMAKYLQQQGHKVDVLTLSTAKHADYEGLNFILPEKETLYRLRGGSLGALRSVWHMYTELQKLVNKHASKYDVLNPHNFPAIWTVPRSMKTVWMCNEIPDLWHNRHISKWINPLLNSGRWLDRMIVRYKMPTAVVADEKVVKIFNHRYLLPSRIVPYGIDGQFFATSLYASSLNGFQVIQPSMISPSKCQMDVAEVVEHLKVKVIFAGYREELNPYVRELDNYVVRNHINAVMTGHVTREQLRSWYYTSHVAVFPGKGQGSWLGPFEALATGRPIIVSPNLTCSSLIEKEKLGIVSDDLLGSIKEVRDNYPKYREQALRGQQYVLNNLTWDKFSKRFEELLIV